MYYWSLAFLTILLAGPPLAAQSNDNTIKLELRPAAEPSPALKYQLLPDVPDQSPGNAALLYYRAFSPDWYGWRKQPKVYEKIDAAMSAPLAAMQRADLGVGNELHPVAVSSIWLARCEYCDWDLTNRVRAEGIGMLLPDMQGFRELSKLLALRTRFYIADRQYDKAVHSLQTGLMMSHQVSEAPVLICTLVGASSAETQLAEVMTLIQAPGAPNLYWALTGLPRPFIDMRKGFGGEKLLLLAEMPLLKDIELSHFGPEQVKALAAQFETALSWDDSRSRAWQGHMGLVALAIRAYPTAKQRLLAQGWKAEDLEELPTLQVVCIHAMREYKKVRDAGFKWVSLPDWQARPELQRVQLEMMARRANSGPEPFLDLIAPGLQVCKAVWRIERRIAALRIIEAIRLYAAANDGRLPARLADIHIVPVPDDPTTGKAFIYSVQGDHFTLTGPAPAADDQTLALTYEATLTR